MSKLALMRQHARRRDLGFLGALGAVAAGLVAIFVVTSRGIPTHVVNALSVPVTVEIAGRQLTVQPGFHDELKLPSGAHVAKLTTSNGKVVLDEFPVVAPRYFDAVVINPLGAAPVYSEKVVYGSTVSPGGPTDLDFFGGRRVAAVRRVDDPFRDPPRQVSAKRGERVSRVHLGLAEGGAKVTMGYLAEKVDQSRSIELAFAMLEQQGTDEWLDVAASLAARAAGPAGALRVYSLERQRRPSSTSAQAGYSFMMASLGREADVVADLARAAAEKPDDPIAGVAHARMAPRAEARSLYDDLLKKHATNGEVGLSAAAFAVDDGRPADALALYARFSGAPSYAHSVTIHAHALFRTSGRQAAYDLLSRWLDQHGSPESEEAAVLAAGLSAWPDVKGDAHHLMTAVPNPARRAVLLAERDLSLDAEVARDPAVAPAIKLVRRLAESTSSAFTVWDQELSPQARALVPLETRVILAIESMRLDYPLGVDPLQGIAVIAMPMSEILAYVRGGPEPPRLFRAHPPVRAAIEYSRSRELVKQRRAPDEAEALVRTHSPGRGISLRLVMLAEADRGATKRDKPKTPKK